MNPVRVRVTERPAAAPWCVERVPDPCALIVFGATGDLVRRKVAPALFRLWRQHLLPERFFVLGVGRKVLNEMAFQEEMRRATGAAPAEWSGLAGQFHYQGLAAYDSTGLAELAGTLTGLEKRHGTGGNRAVHLAVPPEAYGSLTAGLVVAGVLRRGQDGGPPAAEGGPWTRLLIEKPFGRDLSSAQALNRVLAEHVREDQVYRLDHYLGKETVQNLLVFRFGNTIFEPVWNRRYIDHVQITAAETVGVEHRAGYYDTAGVLRDMFQNHLLQLLCLAAMEPPARFQADQVRGEKVKVVQALRPLTRAEMETIAVRGQYGAGRLEDRDVCGYRQEEGVAASSTTETYAAMKVLVDNWRWEGVPFYLRSGKRMPSRVTEIAVEFKPVPHSLFSEMFHDRLPPNVLVIRIQPEEGITLGFEAKRPGTKVCLGEVAMEFDYAELFGQRAPEAYERLLLDCMLGDPLLFVVSDWIEESWRFLTPLLDRWAAPPPGDFPNYAAGSWGPKAAEALLARDGRQWRVPT